MLQGSGKIGFRASEMNRKLKTKLKLVCLFEWGVGVDREGGLIWEEISAFSQGEVSGRGGEGGHSAGRVEAPDNNLSPRRNGTRKNTHGRKSPFAQS